MDKTETLIPASDEKNWLFQAFFFSSSFMILVVAAIQICFASNSDISPSRQTIINIAFQIALLSAGLIPAIIFSKKLPLKRKLRLENWKFSYLPIAIAALILIRPITGIVYLALNHFVLAYYPLHLEMPKIRELIQNSTPSQLALTIALSVLIAPIAEEIFFRRIVFGFLSGVLGPIAACLAASALFASFHENLLTLPALFILGLSFQLMYMKFNSLYPAIILHVLNNLASIIILIMQR
jgi:membrane protease YdiL (CAAX protease family)